MSRTVALDDALAMTVGEVMIRQPKTLPADARLGDVRRLFERPNIRTALLADGGRFAGVIERSGIPEDAPDDAPASDYVEVGTVLASPSMPMREAVGLMQGRDELRLVVLDEDGVTLRGLLCANSTATGFCLR